MLYVNAATQMPKAAANGLSKKLRLGIFSSCVIKFGYVIWYITQIDLSKGRANAVECGAVRGLVIWSVCVVASGL